MRDEYRRNVPDDYEGRTPEVTSALLYAEHELWRNRPAGDAEQWAILESLIADERVTAGDAIVFTDVASAYLKDRRDRFGELSAADFLRSVKRAAAGDEDYARFVEAQRVPGVRVGTDAPRWADFCAWVFYGLSVACDRVT
jgi:hypothetical protein